jgi:hypothetical protein
MGPADHALDRPGVVAHVDERKVLAVLAPAGHPTTQDDVPADIAEP